MNNKKKSDSAKKRWASMSAEDMEIFKKKCRERQLKRKEEGYFKDPQWIENNKRAREALYTEEIREKKSDAHLQKWKDPEYRKKMLEIRKTQNRENQRSEASKKLKELWASRKEEISQKIKDSKNTEQFKAAYSEKNSSKIEGLTLRDIAFKLGISYSYLAVLYRENNFQTIESVSRYLDDRRKEYDSRLEKDFSEKTGLQKIHGYGHKLRPDFKIKDNLFLNLDGLYWHSSDKKDSDYHFNLRKSFEERGERIIQIHENEWYQKQSIVISMINTLTGGNKRIFARNCDIRNVSQKEARSFLENNHLMGFANASYFGLFFEDKLVCIIGIKINKDKSGDITRFCTILNHSVIGGFSKLFTFLKERAKRWTYWVDMRYGTGAFLEQFGFKKIKEVQSWKWTDFKTTFNRLFCRANMDLRKLSQAEYAKEMKLKKIFDAGQALWEFTS